MKSTLAGVIREVRLDGVKVRHHVVLGSNVRLAGLESGVPDTANEQLALHFLGETVEVLELIGRAMIVRVLGGKLVEREVLTLAIVLKSTKRLNNP